MQDKVAFVTGGGIGRAIVLAFTRQGAGVVGTARTTSEIESVAADVNALGRKGPALPVDLSQRDATQSCVEHVFSQTLKIGE